MSCEKKARSFIPPHNKLSVSELYEGLKDLARKYHTTLPVLLRKLDRVSGDIEYLQRCYAGDTRQEWSEEEDSLLDRNEGLLVKWKGRQAVEKRKKYLNWSS